MLRNLLTRSTLRPYFNPIHFYSSDAASTSNKDLLLSFVSPYEVLFKNEKITSVTVPAEEGRFGIFAEHVPSISQLKPGVVEIIDSNKETSKYFVGAGFVGVHDNSTCHITVSECFKLDQLEVSAAQAGLDEAKSNASAAKTDKEKAEARIAVETYESIIAEVSEHS